MEKNESPIAVSSSPRAGMLPRNALLISLLFPVLCYGLLVLFVGDTLFPFSQPPPGREHRAALAIRDNVPPFQKWGTLLFTKRHLKKYYAASWYMTQEFKGDCETEFKEALLYALETYPAVDLFLLAHTNTYVQWVESFPEELRQRIRFVYNTGCHNEPQGKAWLELGADAYIGHPGVSWSPFFYFFLLRHWTRGETLEEVLELGNRRMQQKFRQVEWLFRGKYDADTLIRESIASGIGNVQIRIGDLQP